MADCDILMPEIDGYSLVSSCSFLIRFRTHFFLLDRFIRKSRIIWTLLTATVTNTFGTTDFTIQDTRTNEDFLKTNLPNSNMWPTYISSALYRKLFISEDIVESETLRSEFYNDIFANYIEVLLLTEWLLKFRWRFIHSVFMLVIYIILSRLSWLSSEVFFHCVLLGMSQRNKLHREVCNDRLSYL